MVVDSLIRSEANGTLSFGDFSLAEKKKVSDFEHQGDVYKVKSFNEITKLEKNEQFVYESVPGSSVFNFMATGDTVSFDVTAGKDVQITLELEPDSEYEVIIDGMSLGRMPTNLGGKLVFSVDAKENTATGVKVVRI